MTCYWLFLFSVNMLKGRVILGTGHTVSQRKVHGYELQNNEIAVMVESLKVSSFKHSKYGYDIEIGGFTAWYLNDIEVLS